MQLGLPFASKEMPDGKRLYRRIHGVEIAIAANAETEYTFTVPYVFCKVTGAKIVWAFEGLKADFKIYDNASCSMQIAAGVPEAYRVPNAMLNQFGFDVNIAKDFHSDDSPYDADLYQDMKIKMIFKNSTATAKTIGINIVLHEVK